MPLPPITLAPLRFIHSEAVGPSYQSTAYCGKQQYDMTLPVTSGCATRRAIRARMKDEARQHFYAEAFTAQDALNLRAALSWLRQPVMMRQPFTPRTRTLDLERYSKEQLMGIINMLLSDADAARTLLALTLDA